VPGSRGKEGEPYEHGNAEREHGNAERFECAECAECADDFERQESEGGSETGTRREVGGEVRGHS
jgi:hypothetical protein